MNRLKHILGPSIPKTEARILRALRAPRFYLFVFTLSCIQAVTNPSTSIAAAPGLVQIIIFLTSFGLFVPTYCAIEILMLRLTLRLKRYDVPEVLVMGFTLLLVSAVAIQVAERLGVDFSDKMEVVRMFIQNFIFLEVGSYVYIRFVDIALFPEVYGTANLVGMSLPPQDSQIFLLGTTLPLITVDIIRARAHTTEIISRKETQTIRSAFLNVVAELPTDLGFQIHRSIWVSRRLASRTEKDGRLLAIVTLDGTRLPVARHRQKEFENWLVMIEKAESNLPNEITMHGMSYTAQITGRKTTVTT